MRRSPGGRSEARASALWGSGTKGGEEKRRARSRVAFALAAALLAFPAAAAPSAGNGNGSAKAAAAAAVVDPVLQRAIEKDPSGVFDVIVQARRGASSHGAAVAVDAARKAAPGRAKGLGKIFQSVDGVSAQLTVKQVQRLAKHPNVAALTLDVPVNGSSKWTNEQSWPAHAELPKLWSRAQKEGLAAPAIAIVDSGVAAARADFGGRVIEQVTLTTSPLNTPGDGRGHGTFVAAIASGSVEKRTGGAPNAPIVSIDVLDDTGAGVVSDVIAAADWILANRTRLNIRVANFSLNATYPSTFLYDPLTKAVERLWFAGIVVVTSAGNHAIDGNESGMPFSPANDPFVITVGASDMKKPSEARNAPWSAYGYTLDGFAKPDVGATGRYLIGAVPVGSSLWLERPDKRVATGYMQLSGTSFAAPVVASAAAWILALRPDWGPDQVKGALMVTARPSDLAAPRSLGVGLVRTEKAGKFEGTPPNPNAALNAFVVPDPNGSPVPVFDAAAWSDAAWNSAAWNSAAWNSAAWSSAAWNSAAWSSAAWNSAAWSSAAWSSAAWSSAAWANNSAADATLDPSQLTMTPEEQLELQQELAALEP